MQQIKTRLGKIGLSSLFISIFILLATSPIYAKSVTEAKEAFLKSNDSKALQLFERARIEEPQNDEVCNYLGIIYQKMGQANKAEQIYKKGLSIKGPNLHSIEFNLANLYFNSKRFDEAISYYTKVIDSDPKLRSKAILNRAQVLLTTKKYSNAAQDYKNYLTIEPTSPQREKIERLLRLLADKEAYEKEQARLAQETAERKAAEEKKSAERKAAEEKKLKEDKEAEEKRQKDLMDSLLNDLNNSGDATTGIGAGTEDVRDNFTEPGIDD